MLLDYVTWAETNGHEVKPFEPASIDVEALNAVAASQGTEFKKGDILFIRSGWNRAYKALSEEGRQALADQGRDPLQAQSIGIEPSEKTLRWLWDHSFAAIAGDQPSMEVWPPASEEFFLHEWLLAGWGLPIGELFDLEQLSEECKKKNRYAFFFSSMPLKVSHCFPFYVLSSKLIHCRFLEVLQALPTEWLCFKSHDLMRTIVVFSCKESKFELRSILLNVLITEADKIS